MRRAEAPANPRTETASSAGRAGPFVVHAGRPFGYEIVVGKLAEVTAVLDELELEDADDDVVERLSALRARLLMALASYGDAA